MWSNVPPKQVINLKKLIKLCIFQSSTQADVGNASCTCINLTRPGHSPYEMCTSQTRPIRDVYQPDTSHYPYKMSTSLIRPIRVVDVPARHVPYETCTSALTRPIRSRCVPARWHVPYEMCTSLTHPIRDVYQLRSLPFIYPIHCSDLALQTSATNTFPLLQNSKRVCYIIQKCVCTLDYTIVS